jgi:UDP-N-acetyl-D-mannosaminuronate dehydrogenase
MAEENILVVGLGEIGRPIFEILKESGRFRVYGFDIEEAKMREIGQSVEKFPGKFDVVHVCIPCASQNKFVRAVTAYAKRFKPKLVIIDSTVPPGTTFKVCEGFKGFVAHAPVFGTHRNLQYMMWEMKRWTKVVGGVNAESAKAASNHLRKAGIKTKILSGPVETELTKLLETIYTAWMIVFFQEAHRISRHFDASLTDIVSSIGEIHKMRLDRPVWFPGVIGGHCLIPNTELLLSAYDSDLLRLILNSNEKRKKEIGDKNVQDEIQKVKKVVEELQADLTKKNHLATYKPSVHRRDEASR